MRQTLDDAGAPTYASGLSFSPFGVVQSGAAPQPFGFTGELHHDGLVYLRARWYDAGEGTFLSLDPSRQEQHLYQYASSNPVNVVDPTGELGIFVAGGFGSAPPAAGQTPPIHAYDMGFAFRSDIQGEVIGANASLGAKRRIAEEVIAVAQTTCGEEPIILVGYSRGAVIIQQALWDIYRQAPGVQVHLVVTIAPVAALHVNDHGGLAGADEGMPFDQVRQNVKRHFNVLSEQGNAGVDSPIDHIDRDNGWPQDIPGMPEIWINGAYNKVIKGTSHFSVVAQPMSVFERQRPDLGPGKGTIPRYVKIREDNPSPVWLSIKQQIRALAQS